MMSSAAPAPTASAGLLQLQSVFAALDSISPSLPATQSITLPKLKEALSIYAHWSFPDDDHPNPPTPSTPSTLPPTDTFDAQRRRRREEREGWVRDVVDAVDLNRNGRIEFHELIKAVESAKEEKDRRWGVAAQESQADGDGADDEWQPTREVLCVCDVDGVTLLAMLPSFISTAELKALLRSQGVDFLSDAQIRDMAMSVDPSSATSAGINFPSFFRMMTSTPLSQ